MKLLAVEADMDTESWACVHRCIYTMFMSVLVPFIQITAFYIKTDKQMDWPGLVMMIRLRVAVFVLIFTHL